MLTVSLRGVRFFAHHGLHDEEGSLGNEFEVDLAVSSQPAIPVIHHIQETVNYAVLFDMVKAQMGRPRRLLETLAMEIAEEVHGRFPQTREINISITKINPPIPNFQGQVCVMYNKSFQ
jgi:dihydroneopterin aldolase